MLIVGPQPLPIEGSSPNIKKDRKKFGLRKKKSSKGSSMDLSAVGFSPSKNNFEQESASPLSVSQFKMNVREYSSSNTAQITLMKMHSFSDKFIHWLINFTRRTCFSEPLE